MDHVTKELPDPISEEIRQVLEEVSLGATAEDALIALQQRIPSYDLELIVTAVLIQRRAGGNLAEMMDTIAHTIRERLRLLGEVRVITAEARMSMWLLALLPVGLLVVMSALNPGYMGPMLEDPRGQTLLLAAAGMELLGVFVLRRMSNIEV
jgi:tight adherence protein B